MSTLAVALPIVFDVVVEDLDLEVVFVDVEESDDAEENGRLSSFSRSLH